MSSSFLNNFRPYLSIPYWEHISTSSSSSSPLLPTSVSYSITFILSRFIVFTFYSATVQSSMVSLSTDSKNWRPFDNVLIL